MAADCFEWAVEIIIFIAELIRHRYEYTSHAYPLLQIGLQIIWTMDSTNALKNARSDRKIMATTDQAFLGVLSSLIEMTTQELNKIDRVKYETLITIHLHQRDIFNDLVSRAGRY